MNINNFEIDMQSGEGKLATVLVIFTHRRSRPHLVDLTAHPAHHLVLCEPPPGTPVTKWKPH